MKHGVIFFSLAALLAAPLSAWANSNPDFDDDAKPILRMQPGLLHYVEATFDVKDTGTAKYPGDDDRRPQPPYIFRARPIGSEGPYNLRLLIQPGPSGHVLGVVDITKMHHNQPGAPSSQEPIASQPPANNQPPAYGQPPAYNQPPNYGQAPAAMEPVPGYQGPVTQPPVSQAPVSQAPAPSTPSPQPSEPTADTPSGPIMDSNSAPSANTGQPTLTPPPDPAPSAQ
jgi:hypothetical protein